MELSLNETARQHARWLMSRQIAISENVAHAASPGYRAVDVKPFVLMVDQAATQMATTSDGHLAAAPDQTGAPGRRLLRSQTMSHSGNNVSLDQQLMMANEVHQGYALNAGIVRSFNRMILNVAKA